MFHLAQLIPISHPFLICSLVIVLMMETASTSETLVNFGAISQKSLIFKVYYDLIQEMLQ
jgi:hypothetical protein